MPHLKFTEPLRIETSHFIDCINRNKKPTSGWQEGYQVVNVLSAAQESLSHGGIPIEVKWEKELSFTDANS